MIRPIILIMLCFPLVGCATRQIDGINDKDSLWGHLLVPGYSTYDRIQDTRDDIVVYRALSNLDPHQLSQFGGMESILADPTRVGVDIPTLFDAIKQGKLQVLLALLWDAVKAAGWVMIIEEMNEPSSSSRRLINGGLKQADAGNSVTIRGEGNDVFSDGRNNSSSVVIDGSGNFVSTIGFEPKVP